MSLSSHNGHDSNRVEVLQRIKLFLHPLFVETPLRIMKTVTLLDEITFIIKGSQSHLLIPMNREVKRMMIFLAALTVISLITTTLIIVLVVKMLRSRNQRFKQQKMVLAEGTLAQAVIQSIQQTNAQLDDQPEVLLHLAVSEPEGNVVPAEVKAVIPIISIPAFQKGNTIEVKYMTIGGERRYEVVGAYIP